MTSCIRAHPYSQPKGIAWESSDSGLSLDHTHSFSELKYFKISGSAIDYRYDNSVWTQKFKEPSWFEFSKEGCKNFKSKKDWKGKTVNGFYIPLELVSSYPALMRFQSASLLTALEICEFGHGVKGKKAIEDLCSKDKDSTNLEPISGDIGWLLTRFSGKTNGLVAESIFSKCVGNLLSFTLRMEDKMIRELLFTAYSGYTLVTIFLAILRKTVVSQSALKKLERGLWNCFTDHTKGRFITFHDKKNGIICEVKRPHDRLKMLAQILTCSGYEKSFLLRAIKSLLCQVTGIKVCNDKLLEESSATISELSLSSDANDTKCETETCIINCMPETGNVNAETPSSGGSLFTSNEYDDCAKLWESELGNLISEDISAVDESRGQPLLKCFPLIWSEYCRKYGHSVTCPNKNRCQFFEKDRCLVCDMYHLPRNAERIKEIAECSKKWYDNNCLYVSRSRPDPDPILYKRYYNSVTGYTQIFCSNCGKVCREDDFGSKEKMIGKQLSHECRTYSDISFSIPSSPWMKKDDSWNKSPKREASKYAAEIWNPIAKLCEDRDSNLKMHW